MISKTIEKRAAKMKVTLYEGDEAAVTGINKMQFLAKWGQGKHELFLAGDEAKYLLDDVATLIDMDKNYQSFIYEIMPDSTIEIDVKGMPISIKGLRAAAAFKMAKDAWMAERAKLDTDDEEADQEAEAEVEAEIEEAEAGSGSVVAAKYRARYAERGTPTNCGDWLATTLVGFTTNKEGINTALFEEICAVNGLDLSKYDRGNPGWQGRLRMTGRNLLAKIVWRAGGVLKLPERLGDELRAPAEWMEGQRYKMPKAEQDSTPEAKSE